MPAGGISRTVPTLWKPGGVINLPVGCLTCKLFWPVQAVFAEGMIAAGFTAGGVFVNGGYWKEKTVVAC
jgi:hypothetical protein